MYAYRMYDVDIFFKCQTHNRVFVVAFYSSKKSYLYLVGLICTTSCELSSFTRTNKLRKCSSSTKRNIPTWNDWPTKLNNFIPCSARPFLITRPARGDDTIPGDWLLCDAETPNLQGKWSPGVLAAAVQIVWCSTNPRAAGAPGLLRHAGGRIH